jgi:hypothetical protein
LLDTEKENVCLLLDLTQAVIFLMCQVQESCNGDPPHVQWYIHAALASQRNPMREQIAAPNMQRCRKVVELGQLCRKQFQKGPLLSTAMAEFSNFKSDKIND